MRDDKLDHVQKTLDMVLNDLRELQKQTANKMKTANSLCGLLDQPPMFQDVELSDSVLTIQPDEFYGKQMTEVVHTLLEKRKRTNLGVATVAEIYDGMIQGGFHFQTKNPVYAKRGIYGTLSREAGSFHKLPDGRYGLPEWYPAARSQTNGEATVTPTKRRRKYRRRRKVEDVKDKAG